MVYKNLTRALSCKMKPISFQVKEAMRTIRIMKRKLGLSLSRINKPKTKMLKVKVNLNTQDTTQ